MESVRERRSVEEVKEELGNARVDLEKKRREVEEAETKIARLEEMLKVLEVEEQVGVMGAVNHCDGGDPGASPTLWPPKLLPPEGEVRTCPTCGKTFENSSKFKNHRRRNSKCKVVESLFNFKLLFNVCIVLSPANY